MKTLYHGNRHKTTEMVQEEVYALGSNIKLLSEYTKGRDPIECLCEVCNYSWIGKVNNLLSGQGCNKCAGRINPTLEEFQQELNSKGKDFTVSGDFIKSTDKLTATCNTCGFQWKAVSLALRRESCKCPECRKASYRVKSEPKLKTRIEKEPKPPVDHYNNFHKKLSELNCKFVLIGDYVRSFINIEVICKDCETTSFKRPVSILKGVCAVCSGKAKGSLPKLQEKLNQDSRNIVVSGTYTNAFGKLDCRCTVCECSWSANPHNLDRTGCPSCALTGYDPNKSGYLYYLRVSDENNTYWKIGITNIGLKGRFSRSSDRKVIEVLYCHLFDDGFVAQKAERNILNMFSEYRAENVNLLRAGNTELFTKDVLQMNHLSSWSI